MGISQEEAYEILELPNGTSVSTAIKSYKRLSLQWFPDKHENSSTALEKFEKISQAILTLILPKQDACKSMTYIDMLSLFQQIFFGHEKHSKSVDSDIWDDDDDDAINSENDFFYDLGYSGSERNASEGEADDYCCFERISAQKASKNAEELIEEEEKEKKKAEKRRAKKKKRKEKKKLEKVSGKQMEDRNAGSHTPKSSFGIDAFKKNPETRDASFQSEEDIDPTSAFVAVIAKKKKKMLNLNVAAKDSIPEKKNIHKFFIEGEETNSAVLRSRQLAIRGNEMANVGCYQEAVDLFNEAIKLNPTDHRYYGNRSYCYDRLSQYQRALKDAEKSIGLFPQWPKSYFRKGRAMTGLKQYSNAEKCFEEVLKFDKGSEDAISELAKVRILQITEMGFSNSVAESAIAKYGNVQKALDVLLAGAASKLSVNKDSEIFVSDTDSEPGDYLSTISIPPNFHMQAQSDLQSFGDKKMNPNNPEGHSSLWIGNVKPEVSEKVITNLFSKFGELLSVKVLPEKVCAFVNFKDKTGAGRAMKALQGYDLLGVNLLIRFPDNSAGQVGTTVLKKTKTGATQESTKPKILGPVNGDECYFWRTTGCIYSETCRFKHIKENKGIDFKNWHTKTS